MIQQPRMTEKVSGYHGW